MGVPRPLRQPREHIVVYPPEPAVWGTPSGTHAVTSPGRQVWGVGRFPRARCCGRGSVALCRRGLAVAVRQTGVVGVIDWALRDRGTGRIVVAQWPNTALIVWMAASVVLALPDRSGAWGLALRVVATVALGWWCRMGVQWRVGRSIEGHTAARGQAVIGPGPPLQILSGGGVGRSRGRCMA